MCSVTHHELSTYQLVKLTVMTKWCCVILTWWSVPLPHDFFSSRLRKLQTTRPMQPLHTAETTNGMRAFPPPEGFIDASIPIPIRDFNLGPPPPPKKEPKKATRSKKKPNPNSTPSAAQASHMIRDLSDFLPPSTTTRGQRLGTSAREKRLAHRRMMSGKYTPSAAQASHVNFLPPSTTTRGQRLGTSAREKRLAHRRMMSGK